MGVVEVDGVFEDEEVDFGGRELAEDATKLLDVGLLVPKLLVA